MTPVEWYGEEAFDLPEWRSLAEADPVATVFHAPRFLSIYREVLGAGQLRVASVRAGDRVTAVAPFEIAERRISFLGGTEVTDYMGPVAIPEDREAAAKELLSAVCALDDWDEADLRGLPEDGPWLAPLRAAAMDAGLDVSEERPTVAPCLDLAPTFDAYLASLSRKSRHEIRRKVRRLERALPTARVADATSEDMGPAVDRFVELHRASRGAKGRFMVPDMARFFRRLAEELLPDGTFRLSFLEADGERIAGVVGFHDGPRFRLYNSAYDHARASLAPGLVLITHLIRDLIDRGVRSLDFLTGDLPYKYRFGARARPIIRLVARRRSRASRPGPTRTAP